MAPTVLIETEEAVRVITLNRPERLNAITPDLMDALVAALSAAQADPEIAAIVLTGAGRAFCAGDDLVEQQEQETGDRAALRAFLDQLQEITRLIMLGETPVIGAVRGWAVGGAFSWALNCDLGIWEEGTRAFFPELAHGLFVSGGMTFLLPRWAGGPAAADIIWSGERFDAARLAGLGLVSRIVPPGESLGTARRLAHRIAAYPDAARQAMKSCLVNGMKDELEAALARETEALMAVMLDGAWRERIAANFESGRA